MPFPTGAEILAFAGVTSPSEPETAWANACAGAVADGITVRLNGAEMPTDTSELDTAAMLAGVNCYRRREASFASDMSGSATNIVGDYLESVKPITDRYGNGPGIG